MCRSGKVGGRRSNNNQGGGGGGGEEEECCKSRWSKSKLSEELQLPTAPKDWGRGWGGGEHDWGAPPGWADKILVLQTRVVWRSQGLLLSLVVCGEAAVLCGCVMEEEGAWSALQSLPTLLLLLLFNVYFSCSPWKVMQHTGSRQPGSATQVQGWEGSQQWEVIEVADICVLHRSQGVK